jgi:hypothetical protein
MTITDSKTADLSELRAIASAWHGGMSSPLYAFASSGAIVDGIEREIRECMDGAEQFGLTDPDYATDRPSLIRLLAHVAYHGNRGPVEGWHNIRY